MDTIREIIDSMEMAEDYGDLYDAASNIKDASLREEVEKAIGEYEEDDTEVEVAYSCVTSDLLDSYMYEDNKENLTEGKQSSYKVYIDTPFGIMNFTQTADSQEEANKIMLDRVIDAFQDEYKSKIKLAEGKEKLSSEDEEYFNDEIDKTARQEIEDKLNGGKKTPDEKIEKEMDNINESKSKKTENAHDAYLNIVKEYRDNPDKFTPLVAVLVAEITDNLGDDYSEFIDEEDIKEISDRVSENETISKLMYNAVEMYIEDIVAKKRSNDPASKYYEESKSKKTEGIETRELVSFNDIDNMLYNAMDYADLYEAASYIENNNLRVDVEEYIEQCENDDDSVETAYEAITSDILYKYRDMENVAELKVGSMVTESEDTVDNANEEDLATILFDGAYEECVIDKNGEAQYIEFEELEKIQDWYDENVTEELYNKAVKIAEKVLNNTKFYKDSEGGGDYIELNDNHTLWEIESPEGANDDGSFDEVYKDIIEQACNDFEKETGTKLYLLGRMGRHACVAVNFLNAYNFAKLQEVQERLEKEVIEKANAYLNSDLEESKKVTESNDFLFTDESGYDGGRYAVFSKTRHDICYGSFDTVEDANDKIKEMYDSEEADYGRPSNDYVVVDSETKKITESRENDVDKRIKQAKEWKKDVTSAKEVDDLEDIANRILDEAEAIKDINFAGEDLYNGFKEVMDDPDAYERGEATYIRSVKMNMKDILVDFINNYAQAFEEESLDESKNPNK